MMNKILKPFLDKFVIVYLNDIVIFFKTMKDHRKHVQTVLRLLRNHKLYAKPTKCSIEKTELEFCEHIVGEEVIKPCRSKTDIIEE